MRPLYILTVLLVGVFCLLHSMPFAGGWIIAFALIAFILSGGR